MMRSIAAFLKSLWKKIVSFFTRKKDSEDPSDAPVDGPGEGPVVCYYGCPNSKKAEKLQLNRKTYR